MRTFARLLLMLAGALGLFALWGLGTAGGTKTFDEMDGLIPFFAAVVAAGSALLGALLWWIARRRAAARSDQV